MRRSDHNILTMTILTDKIIGYRSKAKEKKKKITRTIYDIEKMNNSKWEEFNIAMQEKLKKHNFNAEFRTENKDQVWTNRVWDSIERTIKDTMNEVIEKKQIIKSETSKRPKLVSDTYKTNKWLLRIIRKAKQNQLFTLTFEKKKYFIHRLKTNTKKRTLI